MRRVIVPALLAIALVATSSADAKAFGLFDKLCGGSSCDTGCCAEPACGCEAPCEPACGCEAPAQCMLSDPELWLHALFPDNRSSLPAQKKNPEE